MRDRPPVHDARHGLPAQALDELRQATAVTLAVKDAQTAVLGYWVLAAGPDDLPHECFGAVLVPSQVDARSAPAPTLIARAPLSAGWQGVVREHLRPGDTPVAEVWDGQLCLRIAPLPGAALASEVVFLHVRAMRRGRPVSRRWRRGQP